MKTENRYCPIRKVVDGLQRYEGVVVVNGKPSSQTYVDWFLDDAAAFVGYRAMMSEYGFTVLDVHIGFPCVVTVELKEEACAS
jgi:hypothetical protein